MHSYDIGSRQLEQLEVSFTDKERNVYINFLNEVYLNDEELQRLVIALNKILEQNDQLKIYPQESLFEFFAYHLYKAQVKNALGGWSIEKEAVRFIKEQSEVKTILEFGSGNGTDALLRDFDVTSIEHQTAYTYQRHTNHICLYAPIKDGWYKRAIVAEALEKPFDLIIVDGPPMELRAGLIKNLDLFKNLRTPVLFDDVNRILDHHVMEEFCKARNYKSQIIQGREKQFAFCVPLES
ncbi:hypothetical protein [Parapedobacter sp.]